MRPRKCVNGWEVTWEGKAEKVAFVLRHEWGAESGVTAEGAFW